LDYSPSNLRPRHRLPLAREAHPHGRHIPRSRTASGRACRILAATVFLAEAGSAPARMKRASERNAMKRFSVICLQCGLSVKRLIEAETAQTEIHPVTYQQKCKIAPNAADFDCPELERAVERSRRWDPIFQGGMSRPASAKTVPEILADDA